MAVNSVKLDVFKEMERAIDPEVVRELPEKLHRNIVDVIHDANVWCPAQCDPDMKDEYKALREEREELYSKILSAVPPKKRDLMWHLIDDYSSLILTIDSYDTRMAFRQGLRDGFRLAKFFDSDCAVPEK